MDDEDAEKAADADQIQQPRETDDELRNHIHNFVEVFFATLSIW